MAENDARNGPETVDFDSPAEIAQALVDAAETEARLRTEIGELKSDLTLVQGQRNRMRELYTEEQDVSGELRNRVSELTSERDRLAARVETLEADATGQEPVRAETASEIATLHNEGALDEFRTRLINTLLIAGQALTEKASDPSVRVAGGFLLGFARRFSDSDLPPADENLGRS